MQIVIVYESLFGNTHEIAEAIAEGLREARPDAQVACLQVAVAGVDATRGADLLVVGGPTHLHGMSFGLSRKMALKAEETEAKAGLAAHEPEGGAEGPGVRDWFHSLPRPEPGSRAAAFDTRLGKPMSDGAAHVIARRLSHHGYIVVAEPEGFIIEDADDGPLSKGEHDRAKAWGASLV
jgi:hypothetical protein